MIPKISVLMPVYNCRQYIEESVKSILTQTYTDFEFLIIDDCSTDGTFEYLQSLSDPRITLIRKPQNTGYTISLNRGLQMAKGEYIARMDGDDISFPDRFTKQVAFMDNNPDVVVCGGGYEAIGSDLKFVPKFQNDDIIYYLMSFSPIAHPTVFFRKNVLKNNGILYNPKYEPAEDYKMWTTLSKFGKLINLPDILLYYRVHKNQSTNLKANLIKEMTKLIAFEYVTELSRSNINADLFCLLKIKTIEDLVKYNGVEDDIKILLRERGVIGNDLFFTERKRNYLKDSLIRNRYTIPQAINDLKLLLRCRLLLSNRYIIKYLIKSIIYWNAS